MDIKKIEGLKGKLKSTYTTVEKALFYCMSQYDILNLTESCKKLVEYVQDYYNQYIQTLLNQPEKLIIKTDTLSRLFTIYKGSLIEISGQPGSGKSELVLKFVKEILENNPDFKAILIYTESSFKTVRLKQVIPNELMNRLKVLLTFDPISFENYVDKVIDENKNEKNILLVIDSLTAPYSSLSARSTLAMRQQRMLLTLKLLNYFILLNEGVLIYTTQVRAVPMVQYGKPQYDRTGGYVIQHLPTVALMLNKKTDNTGVIKVLDADYMGTGKLGYYEISDSGFMIMTEDEEEKEESDEEE